MPALVVLVADSTPQRAAESNAGRRIGAAAGLAAGPFFLASVGLNTWASLGYMNGPGEAGSRLLASNRRR